MRQSTEVKSCSRCGRCKPETEFRRFLVSGELTNACNRCRAMASVIRKRYKEDNPQVVEENKAESKRWRKENVEHKLDYGRKYYRVNKSRKAKRQKGN